MIAVRGQVLLTRWPSGGRGEGIRPAGIFARPARNSGPLATTGPVPGENSRFGSPREKSSDGLLDGRVWLAARAPGFGLQWTGMGRRPRNPAEPVVLKLVPEVPVHGRIVDLEGRPVRDVRVKVLQQLVDKTRA